MLSQNFLEKLLLAIAGPLTAAVVGTLVIGSFLAWAARRQQERRTRYDLRHELISEMTRTANALYFAILHYCRVKAKELGREVELKDVAPILHAQYRETRSTGHSLDARLLAYFDSTEPHDNWHAAMDLLSVWYYHLFSQATQDLLEENAGPGHSGLAIEELKELLNKDKRHIGTAFRNSLRAATDNVLKAKMRSIDRE